MAIITPKTPTKLVPIPSVNMIPERDIDKRPILECINLGINFGGLKAVDGFDLTIGRTEIAGLIGPNGAGKTTVFNLANSRSGRAIMAIRDNRIAAESVGINVTKYKMIAFVTSAALAGAAGALFAMNYSTIAANKFDFNTSILILVFVVLGGLGNMLGSIVAATALTILPEALRQFADYRMLVYAVVLILVMLFTNNPKLKQFFNQFKTHNMRGKEAE